VAYLKVPFQNLHESAENNEKYQWSRQAVSWPAVQSRPPEYEQGVINFMFNPISWRSVRRRRRRRIRPTNILSDPCFYNS
jgi:hypothetical protein